MAKAIFLSEKDVALLKELIQDYRTRPRNSRSFGEQVTVAGSPDVYVAKIPSGGIPARSSDRPGRAYCQIYKFTDSSSTADTHANSLTLVSTLQFAVCNIYPAPYYGTGTLYARVQRDKFGRWLVEKPSYKLKCKPIAAIGPGLSGTVNVWLNGATTNNTLTAHLNWMTGSETIGASKESLIEYFEDEVKWVFTGTECNS